MDTAQRGGRTLQQGPRAARGRSRGTKGRRGEFGVKPASGRCVDLGWKLAAMVKGWGGSELLASYDTERRQVGHRNVAMTTQFFLAHGPYADGISAIDEDGDDGVRLRARLGDQLVRRSRCHVPDYWIEARLPVQDFNRLPDGIQRRLTRPIESGHLPGPAISAPGGNSAVRLTPLPARLHATYRRLPGTRQAGAAAERGVPLEIATVNEVQAGDFRVLRADPPGWSFRLERKGIPGDVGEIIDRVRGA